MAIESLERHLDIPVVTSNQALVWHSLQLMNNASPVTGFGRLFETSLLDAAQHGASR